ncbi:MAG: hypothetical protein HY906_17010 [Deltaproteobacteria bacterium]|nr:hypothetical protein [Deltaproteobacteria bacterium]
MLYLTAQRVVSSETGRTGINAFRYANAAVRSFEFLQTSDVGVLEAQVIEVPPGGNDILCYIDVLAPDGTPPAGIKPVLEALGQGWSKGRRGTAEVDDVRALFVPGRAPAEAAREELDALVRGLLAVADAAPSQPPTEARPITILVSARPDGLRYALSPESAQRLRRLNGPDWRQVSVTVADDVAADFARVAQPAFGELNRSLVRTLTGVDVLRLHSEFGGVRFVEQASGKTLWEWPAPDVRPGYCLSCHQHGMLRDAGANTFVCAYCGNIQSSDGLWVATLS